MVLAGRQLWLPNRQFSAPRSGSGFEPYLLDPALPLRQPISINVRPHPGGYRDPRTFGRLAQHSRYRIEHQQPPRVLAAIMHSSSMAFRHTYAPTYLVDRSV